MIEQSIDWLVWPSGNLFFGRIVGFLLSVLLLLVLIDTFPIEPTTCGPHKYWFYPSVNLFSSCFPMEFVASGNVNVTYLNSPFLPSISPTVPTTCRHHLHREVLFQFRNYLDKIHFSQWSEFRGEATCCPHGPDNKVDRASLHKAIRLAQ